MVNFRSILAGLVAMAVALAPVAATLVASAGAPAASAAAAHECHGKTAQNAHKPGGGERVATADHLQRTEMDNCSDCDGQYHPKCVGDGGKCCKLIGMVTLLPAISGAAETADLVTNPPTLTGWKVRPPPPPRA